MLHHKIELRSSRLAKPSLFPTVPTMASTQTRKTSDAPVCLTLQMLLLSKLSRQMLRMCCLSRHHGRRFVLRDPTVRGELSWSVELLLKHATRIVVI